MENEKNAALVVRPEDIWTPDEIDTIKKTVAKDANNEELKMFLSLAAGYGLNPLAHEIWFTLMRGRPTIITARDGYLKIALNDKHFRGIQSDAVYAGDKFLKDEAGVHHVYNLTNRGKIVGAYAIVYRDDRDVPAYFFAPMQDYNRNAEVWRSYPHTMIIKVAEAAALKRAFAINGMVTQEEIGYENGQPIFVAAEQRKSKQQELQERLKVLGSLWNKYLTLFMNDADKAKQAMQEVVGNKSSKDFTQDDINALLKNISELEKTHEKKVDTPIDTEFSDTTPDDVLEEPLDDLDDDINPNSPEDLGFVKEVD